MKSLRNTQFFKTIKMQSQTTLFNPPPERPASLTSFGLSPRWIAPPCK